MAQEKLDEQGRQRALELESCDLEGVAWHCAALEAQNRDLLEALKECEEYFDQRADADHNGERYVGNAEMKMLTTVRDAIDHAGGR
jgi:hypothetical protein